MNARVWLALAVCAAVMALGMIAGAGLWMMAAVTFFGVIFSAQVIAQRWSDDVQVTRLDLPGSSENREFLIGSKIPMTLSIHNRGRWPIAWTLIEDASALPVLEGHCLAVMTLYPGQKKFLRYVIECRKRGYFSIGPTRLETGDPLGLIRRYRVVTEPIHVTVLPKIESLTAFQIGSRRPVGTIRIRDNVMADPTRLRGIRQWQPGDPLKSVHWAATARTGMLHTKVHEPSSLLGATVFVDLHASTNPDHHEPFRTDLAITAAASIVAALHDAGEPFGMVTNGRDAAANIRSEKTNHATRDRPIAENLANANLPNHLLCPIIIPADRGPLHLREIVRTLARLERCDGLTLPQALAESQSRLSNQTTLLVILQEATPETLATLISYSRRGWAVAVLVNTMDLDRYETIAGPLLTQRIHVYHLAKQADIPDACRAVITR